MANPYDMRLLSPPIELHWLGWRTDTATLGRNGWQMSVRKNRANMSYELALRYVRKEGRGYGDIYGIAGINAREVENAAYSRMTFPRQTHAPIQLNLGNEIIITEYSGYSRDFYPIDPTPQMVDIREQRLSQMDLFARLPDEDRRIILPEPSFNELLDKALEMQGPKQKEIRDRHRQERDRSRIIQLRDSALIGLVA